MFSSPSSSCLRLRRKSGNGQLIIYTLSLSLSSLDSSTRLHLGHLILSERESQPWAFAALLLEPGTVLPCLSDPGTHMSSYFFLFSVTLLQYFVTCGSSPGYVIDAMRDVDETNAIMWQKMVLDLYPPGTSLSLRQPNTVMTVIDLFFSLIITVFGWELAWYICEESALCIWTLIMYIDYLTNVAKPWWKNAVIILLLVVLVISLIFVLLLLLFHRSNLILTNQSTYELVRRKRIPYMRNMPERVHPFSRGIKRNLYNVCCGNDTLDSLPTAYELEDRSRSYTCLDMLKCRCC
ncbi:hypothetical protein F2Q70_00035565 [Brassica cretica]|uniref:S-acyltransferase n=1 Tax=Brassica cretica TaxID=69181 RepID=A0A8S9JUS1_BRACR|nr:hypothetical protein F2Q70_00035565 [Brassica cretica]